MKKIMIAMLLAALSFNIVNVTAASDDDAKVYEESINFVQNGFSEKNSSIVFGEIDAKRDTTIEYAYDLIELKDNSSLVVFNGTIDNQGEKLPIYAEGEIDQTELSKGQTYLRGSLRGTISNGKELFEVAIGFSGMRESKETSFGVTIYTSSEKYYDSILFLSFGTQVLDEKIRAELRGATEEGQKVMNNDNATSIANFDMNVSKSASWVYEGYDYAYQDHSIGGGYQSQSEKLLRLKTYKDSLNGKVGVALKSYTDNFNVEEFFSPSDPYHHIIYDTFIDEFKIELKRLSPDGSYIVNMENLGLSINSTKSKYLENLFLDFISGYAPCSWTLSGVINHNHGSVTYGKSSNTMYVKVNMSNWSSNSLTFDDNDFYVVFQLGTVNNIVTSYRAYGSVTYWVDTDACIFVVDTEEATESLGIVFG